MVFLASRVYQESQFKEEIQEEESSDSLDFVLQMFDRQFLEPFARYLVWFKEIRDGMQVWTPGVCFLISENLENLFKVFCRYSISSSKFIKEDQVNLFTQVNVLRMLFSPLFTDSLKESEMFKLFTQSILKDEEACKPAENQKLTFIEFINFILISVLEASSRPISTIYHEP